MNTKPKILVIEDRKDIWENLIEHIFPKEAYEISWKNENFENFKVEEHNIQNMDVIICDYYLKNIKGPDVIKQKIKSLDPEIPIVFWTSSLDPHVISETIVGDSVFLKKELKIKIFKEEVDKKIALRRANKFFPLYNVYFNNRIREEELRKSASIIYRNASRYLESFFGHSKFHSVFNAHGLIHIQRVIDNLANLLKYSEGYNKSLFTEEEYYILYISAIIHDLGMIPNLGEETNSETFSKLRNNHCKKIFEMVYGRTIDTMLKSTSEDSIFLVPEGKDENLRYKIALIVLHHDCGYDFKNIIPEDFNKYFANKELNKLKMQLEEDNNLKLMSALLALADKLDYGITRVPVGPSRSSPLRSMKDEFEYLKNECVKGYEINSNENTIRINIQGVIKEIGKISEEEAKELFKKFKSEGYDANGRLTDEGVLYAQKDLIKKVYEDCWDKINSVFNASQSEFLSKLRLEYNFTKHIFIHQLSVNNDDNITKFLDLDLNLDYTEREFLKHSLKDIEFGKITLIGEGKSAENSFYLKDTKLKFNNNLINCSDKFLKFGRSNEISKEIESYKIFATKFLPPNLTIGQIEELKYLDKSGFLGNVITTGNESGISVEKFIEKSKDGDKIKLICNFIIDSLNKFYNINKAYSDNETVMKFYEDLYNERYEKDQELMLKKENRNMIICFLKFKYVLDEIRELKIDLHFSLIHGDFTFRNILYTGDNIVFIDFANSGWGHYFFDFAKLEHYIINEVLYNKGTSVNSEVSNLIWERFQPENDVSFEIEKLLATLYMKLWCLKYEDYEIEIDDRINDFNQNFEELKKLI